MCTAINFTAGNHYFGRNLDLDCSYGEEVCVIPRKFKLDFRTKESIQNHYAIIGMATVVGNVPLLYDGANECGLAMAGLNFPGNAYFAPPVENKDNITPFEFIPWVLAKCKNLNEAKALLDKINLVDISFSEQLPLSPLHWIISDKSGSVVVEQMKDGLHIYDNPTGVLTNNPPFNHHLVNLNNYRNLKNTTGENGFSKNLNLDVYCQGLGAVGLPGDVSSMSRFVRAVFAKDNAVCEKDELSAVGQFFHLLGFVEMPKGVCLTDSGHYDITVYSSCINTDLGLYYYITYNNRRINCVDMHKTDLDGDGLYRFPLILAEEIGYQN